MNSAAVAPFPAEPTAPTQLDRHRQQRQRMVTLGFASYLVDFVLLLAMSLAGGVNVIVPFAYTGAGLVVSIFFYRLLSDDWSERFEDHYFTGPQMLVHAAINLAVTLYVPEIGMLMMMVLFVLFAFCSFGLNPRRLLSGPMPGAIGVAVAVVTLIVMAGDRLSMPTATWQQRAVCGSWVVFILVRSSIVGMYSAKLRALLAKRNSELADTFAKLEQMASRDELTGTLNRRSLMLLLEDERKRMERTGQTFGVALFDLDHFKQVNDGFGHLVGDEALRRFTHAASSSMRNTDRLGRYGGEEFLMLLTATADGASARVAAERVRETTASQDWEVVAPGLKVTVSAGVALCAPGETTEHLLDRADQALYAAKREGRNCVRVANPSAAGDASA